MSPFGRILTVSLAAVLTAVSASAQAPPHIQAAQEFLLAWGKGDWEAARAQAADKVTVKVGGADYTLDVAAKKAALELILPFRGLSTVRVEGKVKGLTVEEIAVKVGGAVKKGKGTVTLQEKEGKFTVTSVAVE